MESESALKKCRSWNGAEVPTHSEVHRFETQQEQDVFVVVVVAVAPFTCMRVCVSVARG